MEYRRDKTTFKIRHHQTIVELPQQRDNFSPKDKQERRRSVKEERKAAGHFRDSPERIFNNGVILVDTS